MFISLSFSTSLSLRIFPPNVSPFASHVWLSICSLRLPLWLFTFHSVRYSFPHILFIHLSHSPPFFALLYFLFCVSPFPLTLQTVSVSLFLLSLSRSPVHTHTTFTFHSQRHLIIQSISTYGAGHLEYKIIKSLFIHPTTQFYTQ